MKINTERNAKDEEVKFVEITIGESDYRITEKYGKLRINKDSSGDTCLSVFPRYSNEIELR